MARGVNKVILIGNLGDEPDCRTTGSGTAVVNISMVTNEFRRNVENGQSTEIAEWHRVVLWGKLAEIASQYLHKGAQVYIEGKLRTRSYTDKQNIKRYVTEIVADEMQMLGSKNDGSRSSAAGAPGAWENNSNSYGSGNAQANSYGSQMQGGNGFGGQPQTPFGANNGQAYGGQPQRESFNYTSQPQGGFNSFNRTAAPQQPFSGSAAPAAPLREPQITPVGATTVDGSDVDNEELPF